LAVLDRWSTQALGSAGALLLGLSACGDNRTEPNLPSSITVEPSAVSFTALGQTQQLSPIVSDQQGDPLPNATVSWTSSNAAVASVSSTGLVTAMGVGNAEVTATAGPASTTAPITVVQTATQLQKVSGDAQTGTVAQPLKDPLVVELRDALGNAISGATVNFTVSAGGGSVAPASAATDANGRASTVYTLGLKTGPNQVVATNQAAGSSTVFLATATAGLPALVLAQSCHRQTATPGAAAPVQPAVRVQDSYQNRVSGVEVVFTVSHGSGNVAGANSTTDANGVARLGQWTIGTSTTNTVVATVSGQSIQGNPVTFTATTTNSSTAFDIHLCFLSSGTPSQQAAFTTAEARWEAIITEDLENVRLTAPAAECGPNSPDLNEAVDDLLILVTVEPIDGPGNVLGSAGPCFIRTLSDLPVLGAMFLDSDDLVDVEDEGLLPELVLHEMGHVLGFGSVWTLRGLLANASLPPTNGTDPHFTGLQARAEFDAIGGDTYVGNKVPVENTGGEGTADGHWRESVFDNELMTGFINLGPNPLSRVALASLADLGYGVDLGEADSYTLPQSALRAEGGVRSLRLVDDLLEVPIKRVDSSGRVVD
jgi:hypothetical protein